MAKPKKYQQKKTISLEDVELTEEFQSTLDLMENSRDCLFITGRAGTGKSTLLRYFRSKTRKNVVVLAPTGIAAIHIGGQTIHSFFQFPPRLIQKSEIGLLTKTRQLVREIDTVIIDEASMVRADLMDGIDYALRLNRSSDEPFGGAQVILIGDLFQLPPVVREEMKDVFEKVYTSPYFFSAKVFDQVKIECVELTHIFRQKDARFISLLNNIRECRHTREDLNLLNSRLVEDVDLEDTFITLTAKNDAAARINHFHLRRIEDTAETFPAVVTGRFQESEYPNDFHLALKKGAQIMMIKNDTVEKRWVNGSLGVIEGIETSKIRVNLSGEIHEVTRERWEKIQYIYNPETEAVEPEVVGEFQQFPVRLAWAITIHKSQGQTFEDVVIDVGEGAFAHGQVYVALSRCTRLEGIRLNRSIAHGDVIFDRRVLDFHAERFAQS